MAKTIKEIADELGYSKTYISKIIKTNGLQTSLRKTEISLWLAKSSNC